MKTNELQIGNKLLAISDASWLIEGKIYEVTDINENEIILGYLHWPKSTVHEHFTLILEP